MRLYTRLVFRDSHQDLGHPVTYIILDDKPQYKQGQQHSDSRIHKEEVVVQHPVEPECQPMMDGLDEGLQYDSGKTAADADDQ